VRYVGADGLDLGGTPITTVEAGTAETDASTVAQTGGVLEWSGSAWVVAAGTRIYLRRTGDPAPPAVGDDIVLTET
jgi:hypothetical protein